MSTPETRRGSIFGLLYAVGCYLAFQASFAYFVLFLNNLWVPVGIDTGVSRAWPVALAINLGLVALWGLQHSVMARRRFKQWWTKLVPAHTERATYCLASALALTVLCVGWSPLPGVIWDVQIVGLRWAIYGVAFLAWTLLLAATFEIDHFELFGIKQSAYALTGRELPQPTFRTRLIYRVVRHPIQTGVFFGMWATPTMTTSHLVFALSMTAYIFVGLYFEERDLVRQFGERYRRYIAQVPKLIPGWPRGGH